MKFNPSRTSVIWYSTVIVLLCMLPCIGFAQTATLTGLVQGRDSAAIAEGLVLIRELNRSVELDSKGRFTFKKVAYGNYTLLVLSDGFHAQELHVSVHQSELMVKLSLMPLTLTMSEVEIQAERLRTLGLRRLAGVEGAAIYEGKKTEVIELGDLVANTANNNPRQIYGKITGLNIWESDGTGLQLGIGGRGLNPDRTSSFNTRQNGYDISADALGYPESYYTPPTEAIDRIEIVRGAASLQYGTQFGGLLNFVFKKGPGDTPFEWTTRLSGGSFHFLNIFNSVGGTLAKGNLNYYAFYQRKQGNGWRPNSNFEVNTLYGSVAAQLSPKWKLTTELTHMDYLARQPGGLTDTYFEDNPRQSVRDRNWFAVDWNLFALILDYELSKNTRVNVRNYMLRASRLSLGNMERINVADFTKNRTLIKGRFDNIASEARLLHTFRFRGHSHTGILGARVYKGETTAMQGDASSGNGPDFHFLNPHNVENSDYFFTNGNYALFAEQIFRLNSRLSITPGIRWEYISTAADGYYKQRVFDAAGNLVAEARCTDARSRKRNFILAGMGMSFKPTEFMELYGNFSQNYRAINFTDLRINNPSLRVDSLIQDERGYTADLGIRGSRGNLFLYEATFFYLAYKDRIGQILRADIPPQYLDYRFRTNIADARNLGFEIFGELNIWQMIRKDANAASLSVFINGAFIHAVYLDSKAPSVDGNFVEMVPPVVLRSGLTWKWKALRLAAQGSYTAEHYSDASNAVYTSTAVEGLIPAYKVIDASGSYSWKHWTLEFSINNILNEMYFTRRAESYPGPGIIPADARSFTVGIQYVFRKSSVKR